MGWAPRGVSDVWQTQGLFLGVSEVWQCLDLAEVFSDLWQAKDLWDLETETVSNRLKKKRGICELSDAMCSREGGLIGRKASEGVRGTT